MKTLGKGGRSPLKSKLPRLGPWVQVANPKLFGQGEAERETLHTLSTTVSLVYPFLKVRQVRENIVGRSLGTHSTCFFPSDVVSFQKLTLSFLGSVDSIFKTVKNSTLSSSDGLGNSSS